MRRNRTVGFEDRQRATRRFLSFSNLKREFVGTNPWKRGLGSVGLEAWQLCEVENYGAGNSGSANF